MAELETSCCPPATQATCCTPAAPAGCCTPAAQAGCCEPTGKGESCGQVNVEGCGCAAGAPALNGPTAAVPSTATVQEVREIVRQKYAALATAAAASVVNSSLGCGVPTAVADLREGETVLDLGSGAGADVLVAARRVGPAGRAIGLDMTDEMLALARRNACAAGLDNVVFVKGYLEQLPLPDASVDVVISNCVINLSGDKPRVLAEAARVLKPGGRFAVSDVIADPGMDDAIRADMQAWTGCIAGALTRSELEAALAAAGLVAAEFRETHRVHARAGAAIIRACKPPA